MLRSLKELEGYRVSATDGDIGKVSSFLFDDERWTIRYLVAKTGSFFDQRLVLLSPMSFRQADWSTGLFHVALTTDNVKKSPSIDADRPVSLQHARVYQGPHGHPPYWRYAGFWSSASEAPPTGWTDSGSISVSANPSDAHLQSAMSVRGYRIQGSDAAIGHVEDFLVDDESWEIRYLVIGTSNWWPGKKVLLAPHWASHVGWQKRRIDVSLSRKEIKSSPEWDPAVGVNREYEVRLYDYYGRPVYWEDGVRPQWSPPPIHAGSSIW